jgi:hypothetical protein
MDFTFDELDMIVPIASIYCLCTALDTANMLSLATNGSCLSKLPELCRLGENRQGQHQ